MLDPAKQAVVRHAVETYIRVASEPDADVRAALLEQCWAADGRLVSTGRELRGRAAIAAMFTAFLPRVARIRIASAIDVGTATFRFHSVAELHDGTQAEAFDAGEVDADGRISLILTFAGPLSRT